MRHKASSARSDRAERRTRLVQGVLVSGIFVAILLGALDQFVVLTALTRIASDLGQASGVSSVVSAYLISSTIGIPVFGRLADTMSRRNVFLLGLATFLTGSALAGFSQNLNELIAFRAVQGFSSGAFIIVGFAIVAVLLPPEARARIAGLFSGSFVIATILGPLLGSYVVDHTTWRWVFFLNLPIGAASALVLATSIGRLAPERTGRFDLPGAALLSAWVASLMLALVETSQNVWGWTDGRVLGLLTAAAALFVGFVVWEIRATDPLVPLRYFRLRVFSASGGAAFFRGAALSAVLAFLAIFVGLVLLRGAPNASDIVRNTLYWFLVPAVLGAATGSQLVVRFGYRTVAVSGLAVGFAGAVLLTAVSASGVVARYAGGFLPTGGIVLALPFLGLGIGLTIPVTLLAAQFAVPQKEVGSATATIQFLGVLGGAIAVALLSAFQQARFAQLSPSPAGDSCSRTAAVSASCTDFVSGVYHASVLSFQDTFAAIAALMALALVAALWLRGRLPKGGSNVVAA